jgi:formylglycine-generating enzyme
MRGLFDLHGNVFEWTHDWQSDFTPAAVTDPLSAMDGDYRVYRRGSWINVAEHCRTTCRSVGGPASRQPFFGFRLVIAP